jgi:FAD synthase
MLKIQGVVQSGLGQGRKLGYPTANLNYGNCALKIKNGVYAGWCYVDNKKYPAAVVVGARLHNPTLLEVHIINFNNELVGRKLKIHIIKKVSGIYKYKTEKRLIAKIKRDIEVISKLFTKKSL